MSIFTNIIEKITGLDLDGSDSKTVVERPCSNCPSNCAIAGDACTVCEPYKRRLIDWVYHVDHLDEFLSQYEVVSVETTASGTTPCPFCGANSADPYICEYCGSKLSDAPASSGKIRVNAASEIPNPIMEAQNVIWERYDAVISKYASSQTKSAVKGSLISDLISSLVGSDSDDDDTSALGAKMSEAEIKEAASLYRVTVGEYLTGLDNGQYLTLKGKKPADAEGQSASYTPTSMGLPGMAAVGMFASSIFSNSNRRRRPHDTQRHPSSQPSNPEQRPSQIFRNPSESMEHRRPESGGIFRPSRPETPQRPSQPARRPSESTERQRPESGIGRAFSNRDVPQRSSGNRRDNLISRTTGERKSGTTGSAPTRSERPRREGGSRGGNSGRKK